MVRVHLFGNSATQLEPSETADTLSEKPSTDTGQASSGIPR